MHTGQCTVSVRGMASAMLSQLEDDIALELEECLHTHFEEEGRLDTTDYRQNLHGNVHRIC